MRLSFDHSIFALLIWIETVLPMSVNKRTFFLDKSGFNSDIEEFLDKGYILNDKDLSLPKISPPTHVAENEVSFLLSKLSDEELLKLLSDQPNRNTYDLNDIVKLAINPKSLQDNKLANSNSDEVKVPNKFSLVENTNRNKKFKSVQSRDKPLPVFRLENKPVAPANVNNVESYNALQKLNELLYNQQEETETNDEEEEKKELLFDVLVAQLKTLCCKKKSKSRIIPKKFEYKSLLEDAFFKPRVVPGQKRDKLVKEYMFLIINDEIRSNGSEELISVDPDSLEMNSSVLLLGPITTPLTDSQLKIAMTRISKELSKPEYLSLLQQLSEGTLSGSNIRLMKSLITGPETRRYIKPHRCNHQSNLARIYGGPKWLICTGYLNLNTPSLYD